MAFVGMDPERIRKVAEQLRQSSHQLTMVNEAVQRLINQATQAWEGQDTLDFSDAWTGQHKLTLQQCSEQLEQMSTDAIEQIAQQEKTSGITPGGPGSALKPGDVIPGTTIPMDGLTPDKLNAMSPEDREKALEAMTPAQRAAYLASLTPEQAAGLLNGMSPEQSAGVLAMMTPAARVAALSAMPTEDRRKALEEMPEAMRDEVYGAMDREVLAQTIGHDVTLAKTESTLSVEAEAVGFKIEAMGQGEMVVNADGSSTVKLHGEFGGGRTFGSDEKGASVTAGLEAEREYQFASPEEAEKFIADLKHAATSVSIDNPNPIDDVWKVLDSGHHVDRFGGYLQAEGHAELGEFGEIAGGGRIDVLATPSEDKLEASLKLHYDASANAGDFAKFSSGGEVEVKGELEHGQLSKIELTASTNGAFGAELEGKSSSGALLTTTHEVVQGSNIGQGGEVKMTLSADNPGFSQVKEALQNGDVGKATELAYKYSDVSYRQTVNTVLADDEHSVKLGAFGVDVAKAGYHFESKAEVSTLIMGKPAGSTHYYDISGGSR